LANSSNISGGRGVFRGSPERGSWAWREVPEPERTRARVSQVKRDAKKDDGKDDGKEKEEKEEKKEASERGAPARKR
jgi:hypothetical protein